MKTCKVCGRRNRCDKVCPSVEARLPKEETGKDAHREVRMSPEELEAAAERYSYAGWEHHWGAPGRRMPDLTLLTAKERKALMLLAAGLSQREAARRLKIKLNALQKRVNAGRAKLLGGHFSHLVEGENGNKRGGGR